MGAFNAVMRGVVSSLVGLMMVAMGVVWILQGFKFGFSGWLHGRPATMGAIRGDFGAGRVLPRSCGATSGNSPVSGVQVATSERVGCSFPETAGGECRLGVDCAIEALDTL